ncbi:MULTISPECIES: ROK family transcriptional regulator [unclassified Luteococcus]|uniref:ROK family transcriptional regulator n=1 Tax=unclassified Luteococcus TaxID=2639923 RepID=UPI00313AEC33
MGSPGSQTSLREANANRILDSVRTFGAITQVELAADTGLSAATVSNIVKQLEADGRVVTSATTRSGRRAQQVSLAATSTLTFGVHIGPRSLDVYLADASHTVQHARHLPLPHDHRYDTTLDRVALLVGEAADQVGASLDEVTDVGVALPADLSPVVPGRSLQGWEDVDVAETLSRRLNRPVLLERQADAAAVAEYRFGALRGAAVALHVRAGESVEACLLLDGQPHRGRSASVGALGHVQVDAGGAICRCGARGCLSTVVSPAAMADRLRLSHGPLGLRQIIQAANRGDAGCRHVLVDSARVLGQVIANTATMLGPDRILLGGELAEVGDLLLDPVREALRSRPLLGEADELLVSPELGRGAEAMGAAALAQEGAGRE